MKSTKSIVVILAIAAGFTTLVRPCTGQTWVGTDDFSTGLSPSNWTILNYQNGGQMAAVGTNGHVSFIVPISTTNEQDAAIVWNGTPAVSNDWTGDISGHNSASWSNSGASQLQLWLFNSTNTGMAYRISMEGGRNQFNGHQFDTRANSTPRQSVLATNSNFGLRLVHRGGVAGDIEAWYDPTGNGTAWTLLDTMNMVDFWPGVVASNTLTIAIISDTYYGPVAEGQIWADNFRLTNGAIGIPPPLVSLTEVFQPNLAVRPVFTNLVLSSNYQLQTTTNLENAFTNNGPAFIATNNVMNYPQSFDVSASSQLFFRLQIAP